MPKKYLFTENISGLFGGVSTQAEPLRFSNQCSEQDNFLGSVGRGLERRNGTKWLAELTDSTADDTTLVTAIDKAGEENFVTLFTGNPDTPIEIYSLDGVKQNLTYESGTKSYVTTNTPRESLHTAIIGDYSIVANKEVQVGTTADLSQGYERNSALVWVKLGQPVTTYTLDIAGATPITYTTPETGVDATNTEKVIDKFVLDIPAGWYAEKISSSVVEIWKDGNGEITEVSVTDSFGDTALKLINARVEKDTDLPPSAPDGYTVNISGLEANDNTNWYVKYNKASETWKETIAAGLPTTLDKNTMPHFLIRTGETGGVYDFVFCSAGFDFVSEKAQEYGVRSVGDDITNALPSFVDEYIIDVSFFRNRLVLLASNSVVLSRANDFFNFFASSATEVFADDPIDIALGSNVVVTPQFIGEFKGGLLVFTENEQYSINSGDDPLEPATVRSDRIGSYTSNGKCLPLTLGTNLYFADNFGDFSVVREYFIQGNTISQETLDITEHAEKYVPKDAKYLRGIVNKQLFLVGVEGEPMSQYLYRTYSKGQEKVQSSWSKVTYATEILGTVVFDDVFYNIMRNGDKITLESLDIFEIGDAFQLDKEPRDDWDYNITPVTSGTGSVITLPYRFDPVNDTVMVVIDGKRVMQGTPVDLNKVSVTADLTGTTVRAGLVIPSEYKFSKWYFKDGDGVGVTSGHLNIRSIDVTFEDTSSFSLTIEPYGRDPYTKTWSAQKVGEGQVGVLRRESDVHKFGINGNTKTTELTIRNDSVFRSRFVTFGMEGAFRNRGQLR